MSVSPGLGLPLVRPTIKICWLPTTIAASRPASSGAVDASPPTSIDASRAAVAPAVPAEVPLAPPNASLPLESGDSVEVIAPDPGLPPPERPRPFGLDTLAAPRLVTWAARVDDVSEALRELRMLGVDLGEAAAGRRLRSDGVELSWTLVGIDEPRMHGAVPFLIDWGTTPHPSASAPRGGTLVELRIEHPEPDPVRAVLAALGLALRVDAAPLPALIASIDSPRGRIELR